MSEIINFPIHFDVPFNHFELEDYKVAIKSLEIISHEINYRIFSNKLDFRIIVLPSEKGSFKAKLGFIWNKIIIPITVIPAILSVPSVPFVQGFIEGFTNEKFDDKATGKEIGQYFVNIVENIFTTENELIFSKMQNKINCDKAIKAKSDFYKMCLNNQNIKAIGFDEGELFPIHRNSFYKHIIIKDLIREVESDFQVHYAIIISSININSDQPWKFKDIQSNKSISARMRDDNFKRKFLLGQYPLKKSKHDDMITITIEYKKKEINGEIKDDGEYVTAVHKFNNINISQVPNKEVSLQEKNNNLHSQNTDQYSLL